MNKTNEQIVAPSEGNKVEVFTLHQKRAGEEKQVSRKTITAIYENGKLSFGISTCGPKDNFCRKIGKAISEGRAKKLPIKEVLIGNNLDMKAARMVFLANAQSLMQ